MKKRFYSIFVAMLVTILAVAPVYAGGVSIKIGLGSITVDLTAWGVGNNPSATLFATGVPVAWCQDPGNGNIVPGQNPAQASARDVENLTEASKGKFSTFLRGQPDFASWTAKDFGCANNNWTATPYFVEWQSLTVKVLNSKGVWMTLNYDCTTTYTGVDYNNTPNNTFDDGTITCTQR